MAEESTGGKLVVRDADGNVAGEHSLEDDNLHGETVLYESGRVTARMMFRAGQQDGESVFYSKTGQVTAKSQYAGGKLNGESSYFSPSGKLLRKARYRNGELHGWTIDYHPNGKARLISHYQTGLLDGESIQYDEEGAAIERLCYKEGRQVPCLKASPTAATRK